jgi:nicotinate phosphoribosyltransferase
MCVLRVFSSALHKSATLGGFGIGTSLTNDFCKASNPSEKSKALNMVIKLGAVDGKQCIKISDDVDKVTGDEDTAARVKALYGL